MQVQMTKKEFDRLPRIKQQAILMMYPMLRKKFKLKNENQQKTATNN